MPVYQSGGIEPVAAAVAVETAADFFMVSMDSDVTWRVAAMADQWLIVCFVISSWI